jgi:hypothetical protein
VYVWLVLTAAGFAKPFWRRLKRYRAQGWSSVSGRIESVNATQPKALFFFTPSKDSSATHVAELDYSYSMAGNSFAGSYYREFPTEWEARDFLRDLEGKTVTVLVDPDKPSSSTLSESAVETLLQRFSTQRVATRLESDAPMAMQFSLARISVLSAANQSGESFKISVAPKPGSEKTGSGGEHAIRR